MAELHYQSPDELMGQAMSELQAVGTTAASRVLVASAQD